MLAVTRETHARGEDSLQKFTTTSTKLPNKEVLTSVPLASDCDRRGDSTDIELSAWQYIWDILMVAILSSVPLQTVQSVKPAVRGLFQE